MASTTETGHAKNIANFQTLIEFLMGYGSSYNPSKTSLQLPAIIALKDSAEIALADVLSKNTIYNGKVSERQEAFSGIKTMATRFINAIQASNASEGSIKEAKFHNRRLQGKRASAPKTPVDPGKTAPVTISASQQSYDQLIQHLSGLKMVLENEPNYQPNEPELLVDTLASTITDLQNKNLEVIRAYANVNNARITRNKLLYGDEIGICEIASDIKKYIKAIFGATSPEFAQIKGIEFSKIKN
ncbi:hypothetical protein [Chryseobacterium sp.]|uniref:hypothetical protein n=1 Tax=Chryseobacterium sp. TaxID=1871047 RepID=UPI002FC71E7B